MGLLAERRVKGLNKEAALKKPCEKLGEYSLGYSDWETYVCELEDDTIILVQEFYSHVSARRSLHEIWLSTDEQATLKSRLVV